VPPIPPQLLGRSALLAAALLAGCGSDEPPAQGGQASAPHPETFYGAALQRLEKAPALVRQEVLKTCDKWRHLDVPCEEERVRRDQLECFVEKGEPVLEWTAKSRMRPRARAARTLLDVNLCMELRRWRKLRPGPDLGRPSARRAADG
jgi:hypothetical protein